MVVPGRQTLLCQPWDSVSKQSISRRWWRGKTHRAASLARGSSLQPQPALAFPPENHAGVPSCPSNPGLPWSPFKPACGRSSPGSAGGRQ